MSISQFPAASSGGGLSNDFILDKNGTTNTTFTLPREFAAGGYTISLSSGDTSYDVYFINATGSAIGYSNGASIVASEAFSKVVVLGVGTAEAITFGYSGPSVDATTAGDQTGAGPYLVSITPSDLGQPDDTAIVAGGNFASNVEVAFLSGTVTKAAKNVVVGSSTALVVTRPDDFPEDLAPYDIRAVNPDTDAPTSGANILTGTVTAGTDPSFITTSPILGAQPSVAYSSAILASDAEGSVIAWAVTAGTVPPGLTLGTADGALAGTPTTGGEYTFTVQITDDSANTNTREFTMPVGLVATGGTVTTSGGTTYHTFLASDDIVFSNASNSPVEYLIVAGGGGSTNINNFSAGNGGGGVTSGTATIASDGTVAITVGGGASVGTGSPSDFAGFATALGGTQHGASGNGFAAGAGAQNAGGGGGGAGAVGVNATTNNGGAGGAGVQYGAWATAINLIFQDGYFGGGGGGTGADSANASGGAGGGGRGGNGGFNGATAGSVNSGGGGGHSNNGGPKNGGSGVVVIRY